MVSIFGLHFISEPSLLHVVQILLQKHKQGERGYVVTVNPEILLHAWRNQEYHAILSKATIRTIDGSGFAMIGSALTRKRLHRAHGSDLLPLLLDAASVEGIAVHFVIKPIGLVRSEILRDALMLRWRSLRVSFSTTEEGIPKTAQLIFANHGAPEQEILLARALEQHSVPAIGMGIGGAADFLIGTQIRAPRWMRTIGIEWLYRLIRQPKRIKRIVNAVIVFPVVALFHIKD